MASQINQIHTEYISTPIERKTRRVAFNAIMRTYRHTLITKEAREHATDYAYHLLHGQVSRQDLINAFDFNRFGYLKECKMIDAEYLTLKAYYKAERDDYQPLR